MVVHMLMQFIGFEELKKHGQLVPYTVVWRETQPCFRLCFNHAYFWRCIFCVIQAQKFTNKVHKIKHTHQLDNALVKLAYVSPKVRLLKGLLVGEQRRQQGFGRESQRTSIKGDSSFLQGLELIIDELAFYILGFHCNLREELKGVSL